MKNSTHGAPASYCRPQDRSGANSGRKTESATLNPSGERKAIDSPNELNLKFMWFQPCEPFSSAMSMRNAPGSITVESPAVVAICHFCGTSSLSDT